MSKWISGQQLLNDFGIIDIELFSDYVKKGLQPYNQFGKPISPADIVHKITNLPRLKKQYEEQRFSRLEMGKDDVNEFDATIGHELLSHIESFEKWALSTKDVDWNEFELPDGEAEATAVLKELTGSLYHIDDIKKVLDVPKIEIQKAEPAKALRQDQKDKLEVQRVAKELFIRHPEIDTVKEFCDLPEISGAGGKHYAPDTRKKWISEVAPERLKRPGIRPKKK